jgi:hypothetical protein
LSTEESPAFERNAHYLQIVWLDDVVQRPIHVILAGGFRLAVDPEKPLVVRA